MSTARMRRRQSIASTYVMFKTTQRYLPPFVRGVFGLLLLMPGLQGFLPVVGFWMIPLGIGVLATDIPPLQSRLGMKFRHSRRRPPGG